MASITWSSGAQSDRIGLAELPRRETPSLNRNSQPSRMICFSDGNALKQVSSTRHARSTPLAQFALSALQGGEGGDPSRSDGEGEVGIGERSGIPHLTPPLPPSRGRSGGLSTPLFGGTHAT